MENKKFILSLLATLLLLKFMYVPWLEWVEEQEAQISQLSSFDLKQQEAINNDSLLLAKLEEHQNKLSEFKQFLPVVEKEQKANALWFRLIDSVKDSKIKLYGQKVDFEKQITSEISFITGSFSMSGNGADIAEALLSLELKAPYVFLDQVKLNRSSNTKVETLVAQINVGYWFTRKKEKKS